MIRLGEWIPAPRTTPTPEERLQMVARFLHPERTAEIAIYEHGTVAVRVVGVRLTLDEIMRHYDVPFEGEGSPYGDIRPTPVDDGSWLFAWPVVYDGDQLQGEAIYAAAESEIHQVAFDAASASTEVFQIVALAPDLAILHAGLAARRARTLDAKELKRIAHWSQLQ